MFVCFFFFFFFFFFCNGHFPPSFPFFLSLSNFSQICSRYCYFHHLWCLILSFFFSFLLNEWKLQEKKTIQNLKNSKLHFSFPFNSFFLSKRDPSMILNARKCNEFICLLLSFWFPFHLVWIQISFSSFSSLSFFLLFHSFFSSMFYLSFLNDCQSNLLPNALAAWEESFPDCFGKRKLNEWIIDLKIEDLNSLPTHRKENVSAFLKKHRIHVECHDVVAFVISFWIQFDFN